MTPGLGSNDLATLPGRAQL